MPATIAGDYTKATVDGQHIRSYVISHLDPNTIYEIRMQTFDSKHASDLSQKMHTKTSGTLDSIQRVYIFRLGKMVHVTKP